MMKGRMIHRARAERAVIKAILIMCVLAVVITPIYRYMGMVNKNTELIKQSVKLQESNAELAELVSGLRADTVLLNNKCMALEDELAQPNVEIEEESSKISRGGDLIRVPINLADENKRLRETLSIAAKAPGIRDVKRFPGPTIHAIDKYNFVKELGTWTVTYYAPCVEECGNTKGMGSSGVTVTPGLSAAIDPKYWKYGTMFYVEGFGVVRADDKGSAIQGQKRMDICLLNSEVVDEMGARKQRVWLIEEIK